MSIEKKESVPPSAPRGPNASSRIHFEKPANTAKPEKYAAVKNRADEAFHRLDYTERLETGKVDFREAMVRVRKRLESQKQPRRHGVYVDHELLKGLHERLRVMDQAHLGVPRFMYRYLRDRRAEAFIALSHRSLPLVDPKSDETLQQFSQDIPVSLVAGNQEQQLKLAKKIVAQYGLQEDAQTVRAALLQMKKDESEVRLLSRYLERESSMAVLSRASVTIDDPEKAFATALKESPELRHDYEEYLYVWKSESVGDVFGPPAPDGVGGTVEAPSREQSLFAVRTIVAQGVTLHLGGNNLGEAHFGQLIRDIAVYNVDGQPKFFIYDRNADRGVIGPVEPVAMRRAMADLVVDEYFSERFQRIATAETEVDPTKVMDASLFKIVRAFFPRQEQAHEELDLNEQRFLDILAYLLVTTDGKYVSLSSKMEFLNRVVSDPQRLAKARLVIESDDLRIAQNPFSLSAFESLISQGAH